MDSKLGGSDKLANKDDVQVEKDAMSEVRSDTARNNLPMTVFVGLVTLMIGIVIGYFGRPLLAPQLSEAASVSSADTASPSTARDGNPSPPSGNQSAGTLMDSVVAQTRHFKGNPDAPITIIEFGDFQ